MANKRSFGNAGNGNVVNRLGADPPENESEMMMGGMSSTNQWAKSSGSGGWVLRHCRTGPYIFLVISLEHHRGGSETHDELTAIEPERGNEIVCTSNPVGRHRNNDDR